MNEDTLLASAQQHHQAGQIQMAETSYREVLSLNPSNAAALYGLAVLVYQSSRVDEAATLAGQLVTIAPANAQSHHILGTVQKAEGKAEAAIASLEMAAACDPENPLMQSTLGAMYRDQGNYAKAIEHYAAATQLHPGDEVAWSHLANAYWQEQRFEEATEAFRTVTRLMPEQAYAHQNLGYALCQQGEYEAALECYRRTVDLKPAPGVRLQRDILTPVIMESEQQIDEVRERLNRNLDALLQEPLQIFDPVAEIGTTNSFIACHGRDDKALQMKFATLYSKLCPSLSMTAEHCADSSARHSSGIIRVGFLSKFFKNHGIGWASHGVIEQLSRDRFEVVAIFLDPPEDETAQAIARAADEILIIDNNLESARRAIAASHLDILFYQDDGIDPFTYFLSFARLAPVQCASVGHPETTGVPTIDYYVSTELWEPEDGPEYYSEKLIRLKDVASVAYYHKPAMPGTLKPRSHFFLREDEHIYICPQALFKLHPDFDEILGGILRRDPAGKVVLVEGRYPRWSKVLQRRFDRSLPDVADRIQFVPRQHSIDFINLIAISDVMLDTTHFCGFNTALEAFAAGTPVVTLPGRFMRSRHTAAFYTKMNIPECIASDMNDYVEKAVRLGTDPSYRDEISGKITHSSDTIWEETALISEFEHAFETMIAAAENP